MKAMCKAHNYLEIISKYTTTTTTTTITTCEMK